MNMKKTDTIVLLVLFLLTLGACNSDDGSPAKVADISGSYYFWPPDDDNDHDAVFVTIDQAGKSFTLSHSCTDGTVVATGVVHGETVTLSWDVSTNDPVRTIGFTGVLAGNDIYLTSENGENARLEKTLQHACGSSDGAIIPGAVLLESSSSGTTCAGRIRSVLWSPLGTEIHSTQTGTATTVAGVLYPELTCSDLTTTISENKKVENATIFNTPPDLYPGAVIQGGSFLLGDITPVNLARAGGTLTIRDLAFEKNCPSSVHINATTLATVTDAISGLLNCGVAGTPASFNLSQTELFSNEKWAFDMNLNVNMTSFNVMTSFNASGSDTKNDEMLFFTQQFYRVSFAPDSGDNFAGFFSDTAACAASDSISDGNAPLYVKEMTYGRIVMVVASSEHSTGELHAALSGAYTGLTTTVTGTASASYQQIMDESSVSYMAYGGGAQNAVQPISKSSTTSMFDAVREMLANQKAAVYAPDNPGLPVAYSLSLVKDGSTLTRNLSTTFTGKDCAQKPATETFTMHTDSVDDDLYFYVYDQAGNPGEAKMHIGYGGSLDYHITPPSGTYCTGDACWKYLEFKLTNASYGDTGAHMKLLHNDVLVWEKSYGNGWCFWGDTYDARFRVNILTGDIVWDHSSGYYNWKQWVTPDW